MIRKCQICKTRYTCVEIETIRQIPDSEEKNTVILDRVAKKISAFQRIFLVDFVRVQWNQIFEELQQWQQLKVDVRMALAA